MYQTQRTKNEALWTVDIKGNPQMMKLENGLRNRELKFR